MEELSPVINYIYSSTLKTEIQIKIGPLEGLKCKHDYKDFLKDTMLCYCGVCQNNVDLMVVTQVFCDGRALTVPITSHKSFTKGCNRNEWLILPLKFSDLPRKAILNITLYDYIGSKKAKPIGGTSVSFFGKYGLFRQGLLDLYVWPNVVADGIYNTTPGILKSSKNRMQLLYKLMRKHRDNAIPKIDWLDRLSFREMELICDKEKKLSNKLYLTVEFPEILCNGKPFLAIYYEDECIYQYYKYNDINCIQDSEILQDNLAEDKHHKLSRSIRARVPDKDAKPNSEARDLLLKIVAYPPTKSLTAEEQDLLWKYRFYLSDQRKALIKFLKCINWNQKLEVQQAVDMMLRWAPMNTDDALQLLAPAFSHPAVRKYAVDCLKQSDDENLLLYFLQLVQALRYENIERVMNVFAEMQHIVKIEENMSETNFLDILIEKCNSSHLYLLSFLIYRASQNFKIANYLYWYLTVECEDSEKSDKFCELFSKVRTLFMQTLKYGETNLQNEYFALQNQQVLIDNLVKLTKIVVKETGNRTKKMTKLQELLNDTSAFKLKFSDFDPISIPVDPDITVESIIPEKALLFKSKLMPTRLTFLTTQGLEYVVIFKYGDDLRQDQLVLQVITLIDNIFRSENLDLKLTPYKIIATSTKHGFVQYVQSFSIGEILSKEGNLQSFFRKYHPNNTDPYGISSEIMDTYIKSCAGYSVITYLLGVGDRHLDNLMITTNGNLFHIDFGYILGRDPKPLPPPMKLSKEMVEAMGGTNGDYYSAFKKLCFTAFLILRRHADLILSLFLLMTDSNIPDIALEPDKAVKKIEEKLCLSMGDEEAVQHFQYLLDTSAADVMAAFVDQLHKLVQYYRD